MKKKIGILGSCFVMMSYLAISPIIADVSKEFGNVDVSAVQMLITLPSLVALVFSLLAGRLASKMYKKTMIMISMCAYLAGGLLPLVFNHSIWMLLVFSGIIGVGTGGMITTTSAIICDYYKGRERSQMMGLQAAFISGGGMIFTILGGWLSTFGWRSAYMSFLLVIPFFFIAMRFLPKGILEVSENQKSRGGIPVFVWFMSFIGFLFYVCQNTFNTNISLYMAETHLGTAQTAGFATSMNTFAGILAGVLLGQLSSIFKKYSVPTAILLAAAGLLMTFAGHSLPLVLFGGFLVGFGFSMFTPAGTLLVAEHVDPSRRSMCIAVFSACNNIGAALSPVIINMAAIQLGSDVKSKFILAAIVLGWITVIAALQVNLSNRKTSLKTEN